MCWLTTVCVPIFTIPAGYKRLKVSRLTLTNIFLVVFTFPITSLNWVVGPVTRAVLGLNVGSNRAELCWITISDDSQDTFEADGSYQGISYKDKPLILLFGFCLTLPEITSLKAHSSKMPLVSWIVKESVCFWWLWFRILWRNPAGL